MTTEFRLPRQNISEVKIIQEPTGTTQQPTPEGDIVYTIPDWGEFVFRDRRYAIVYKIFDDPKKKQAQVFSQHRLFAVNKGRTQQLLDMTNGIIGVITYLGRRNR